MKKTTLLISLCFVLFLILPLAAKAFAVKADNSVYVAQDEVIEGNLYAVGNIITVDGAVIGDVICAGQTININGKVEGDVICAGQTLNILGQVNGSVRTAGNSVNINGPVARNVMAFGASIILGKDASVGWDMLIAGASGDIRGKIGNDLYGGAANVVIAGEIVKDVRLKLDERVRSEKKGLSSKKTEPLTITKEAVIGGNVVYTAGNEGSIADEATISGEITHNLPKAKPGQRKIITGWAWGKIYSIFSALVIGLVLISLWREQIIKLTDKMLNRVGVSIGWGLVIMFLTPIIAILLIITLIGIPLAVILIGVWLIALFLSKIIVGILIGRSVLEKLGKKKKESLIWAMIIGIILSWILFSIPFIGWMLCLIALWWGLGGIWLYFRKA